jgi:predicted glycosyltransferase
MAVQPPSPAQASALLRAWIDIENPPQVQYLVPLVEGFRRRGHEVLVTARDYGDTFELLERRGVAFDPVAAHFGASKLAKITGSLRRTASLCSLVRAKRPNLLVSASRSASLAARILGIPSFALCDYEYVNLTVFRVARSFVVHPSVIEAESFVRRGVRAERLVPYDGIKEDITFADVDLSATPVHAFPELEDDPSLKILLRPPAEESHYHRESSSASLREALHWLASLENAVTIYAPRYAWQASQLGDFSWSRRPVVLDRPVDFRSLYQSVDLVLSGGGTMTREAAYLGVPAVTMFQGLLGDVDRYLASIGRVTLVSSRGDFENIDVSRLSRMAPLRTNPRARDDVLDSVLDLASARQRTKQARG